MLLAGTPCVPRYRLAANARPMQDNKSSPVTRPLAFEIKEDNGTVSARSPDLSNFFMHLEERTVSDALAILPKIVEAYYLPRNEVFSSLVIDNKPVRTTADGWQVFPGRVTFAAEQQQQPAPTAWNLHKGKIIAGIFLMAAAAIGISQTQKACPDGTTTCQTDRTHLHLMR